MGKMWGGSIKTPRKKVKADHVKRIKKPQVNEVGSYVCEFEDESWLVQVPKSMENCAGFTSNTKFKWGVK